MATHVNTLTTSGEQARTRQARAAVVEAARHLFLQHGYAATTLAAVSESSGVPVATLYRLFSSKIGVLKAVLDVAAGGDDQPVAFGDRPDVVQRLQLDDPVELLETFAGVAAEVMQRVAPVHQILVGAAATDPDAAHLMADFTAQRRRGQARIARALAARHALAAGITERHAADIIFTLMSPEVYGLLTVSCGWTAKRYRQWLAHAMTSQLLP
jgi:AcrR family transcriptional regulator